MDAPRFDNLSRAIGRATSRRRMLLLLVGGTAGMAVPALATRLGPALAGDGAATPISPMYICAPGNTITVQCHELVAYLEQCGMVCPNGQRKFAYGCTVLDFSTIPFGGPVSTWEDPLRGWCARQTVRVEWRINSNRYNVVDLQPDGLCCTERCHSDIAEWRRGVEAHEEQHRTINVNLIADANARWASRNFSVCGAPSEIEARNRLLKKIDDTTHADALELQRKSEGHPPGMPPDGPPPDCFYCRQKNTSCDVCSNGECVNACGQGTCCTSPGGGVGCCVPGDTCCPPQMGGGGCCPGGVAPACCGPETCCPSSFTCCTDFCCPPDATVCCPGGRCCPAGTVCCGASCCPPGTRCTAGGCRPLSASAPRAEPVAALAGTGSRRRSG